MLSYSLGERNILNPAHDVFLLNFVVLVQLKFKLLTNGDFSPFVKLVLRSQFTLTCAFKVRSLVPLLIDKS